ncbi:MAG: energy transducer TonB [Synoicihabitans sp.]
MVLLICSGCESTSSKIEVESSATRTVPPLETIYTIQEVDRPPTPRTQTKPNYPFEQRANGQEGKVLVGFIVNQEGIPEDVKVLETNNAGFNVAAINSVSEWRFRPGEKNHESVKVAMTVPIIFSIVDPDHDSYEEVERLPLSGDTINFSEADEKPRMKKTVKPNYPEDLRTNGIEGEALISFVVGIDGFTHQLKIIRTTHDELGLSARYAIAQWQFTPGKIDGNPVNVAMQIPIIFSITD